jgi:uracil-DNA glycosylase family 4
VGNVAVHEPEWNTGALPAKMPWMADELRVLAVELERHLAWQGSSGLRTILGSPRAGHKALPPTTQEQSPVAAVDATRKGPARGSTPQSPGVVDSGGATAGLASPRRTLDEVRRDLGDCTRCGLCKSRVNLVFGVGSPKAELVFVGEGPGQDEDLQGVPFVGKAGQLLTKMIEAMTFSRDGVYICNVVKCRPPNNRNPEPDEIAACEPFLKAQLSSLRPKVIVALGKFAAQTLLNDPTPISRLRGQWKRYEGIDLMPTFHPAYLLRTPADKKLAWLDLQEVMKKFGRRPA